MAPVLALVAVLTLGMAACGGGDDEEAESTTTTAPAVQGADMVSIDMTDYAYNVSGPLTAGGMLKVSNSGKEFHMFFMGKFKPGRTLDQLRDALMQSMDMGGGGGEGGPTTTAAGGSGRSGATTTAADGDIRQQTGGTSTTTASGGRSGATTTTAGEQEEDPMGQLLMEFFEEEIGFPGSIMGPGQSVEITVPNLTPGTYALVCPIPTEGEGTPHFHKGMINQLEVVEGPTPPEPTADATYRIAEGQAIQGPATLTAGRHVLKIEAAPGSQQLEPGLAMLDSGTTIGEFDEAGDALFEGEEPPPRGAADRLPGELVWQGFDLGGVTSFYLTTDFKSGTYAMVGNDTDVEDAPSTPRESITIRVT